MAVDRGRDLKVSILSDADQFDVDQPARDLDKLAERAEDADKALTRLGDGLDDSARKMRDLGDDTDQGGRGVRDLGDDAKDTARKVDNAFEAIARSSRQNLRNKLDDDTDKAAASLHEVRDEANDTAREMGASFDGSAGSVLDAFQELGANAGQAFGPIGIAAGAAAAVGVGLIRAEAEKLQELAGEMTEAMIEAGGRLSEEFIDQKLQDMASDGTLVKLQEQAADLGLSFEDLARAKAGDGEAADRLMDQIADLSSKISENAAANGVASGEMYAQQTALGQLAKEVGTTAKAHDLAARAAGAYADAARTAGADTQSSAHVTGAAWDDLRSNLGKPITAKVAVSAPSPAEIAATRATLQNFFTSNPLTVNVNPKPGQGQGYGVVRARP